VIADRLRWIVEDVAQTIVGLDVALFFQGHPNVFDTAQGIALRMGRRPADVEEALKRLVHAGLLELYELGAGRYRCYALNRNPDVWDPLCRLSEMYLGDPVARGEIITILTSRQVHPSPSPDGQAANTDTRTAEPDSSTDNN
jgi:hypothetical protein